MGAALKMFPADTHTHTHTHIHRNGEILAALAVQLAAEVPIDWIAICYTRWSVSVCLSVRPSVRPFLSLTHTHTLSLSIYPSIFLSVSQNTGDWIAIATRVW